MPTNLSFCLNFFVQWKWQHFNLSHRATDGALAHTTNQLHFPDGGRTILPMKNSGSEPDFVLGKLSNIIPTS